jgi:hypothetical protein
MWQSKKSISLTSYKSAALENLDDDDDDVDIGRIWESIRRSMITSAVESLGYCDMKQHKPRLH